MKILVTGAAGFIGMHVALALLARGDEVVGVDSLNDYYDPALKEARLARLTCRPGFRFERLDITNGEQLLDLVTESAYDGVVHLAAQAGVRHSISHPHAYAQANLVGFLNVLEACRAAHTGHLVYASSSSVYGGNTKLPFAEDDPVDAPVSLYAATKKANELMAHSYSHLYRLPCTGLRFFTVYGPWGRPDMAYWLFTRAILAGEPVRLFNGGDLSRDFTYIDDIVSGVLKVLDRPPADTGAAPCRVLNIGHQAPVPLTTFVATLERLLGRRAVIEPLPMQAGDVKATVADLSKLHAVTGTGGPGVPLEEGLRRFVRWYCAHHARAADEVAST